MENIETIIGSLEIDQNDVVFFPEGLLGLSHFKKFVFINDPNDDLFIWLQSLDDKTLAFPLIEADILTETTDFEVHNTDYIKLNLEPGDKPQFYCILNIPEEVENMTANLKAPICLNKKDRLAYQFVLKQQKLKVQLPVFDFLKNRFNKGAEIL